ncbi:MAG TPA: hypothetical protein PKA27_11835 [Fimbriimonadaceae bacterium]|nr:hypothetical protein [Fimbriimonadaceae bacterium]
MLKPPKRLTKFMAERSPLLLGLFPIAMGLLTMFWIAVAIDPGWDWESETGSAWQIPTWAVRIGLSQELVWDIGRWPGRACLVIGIVACIAAFWNVRLLLPAIWCLLSGLVLPIYYVVATF